MERWVGRIAVVTGASVGIGAKTCVNLADRGIIVVGLARRVQKIHELSQQTNGKIHAVKCDLTKEDEILNAFRWIEAQFGGVDILINNAGILTVSSLVDGDIQEWRNTFELNVLGLSICTKEALKTMKTRNNCHIIHINSVTGHRVLQNGQLKIGAYSASKFAVTALAESLRVELQEMKSDIKVTSISPGPVLTDMLIDLSRQMNNIPSDTPPPVLITQDIADAILYALGTRPGVEVQEIIISPSGITQNPE